MQFIIEKEGMSQKSLSYTWALKLSNSHAKNKEAADTDLKVIERLQQIGWKRGDTLLYRTMSYNYSIKKTGIKRRLYACYNRLQKRVDDYNQRFA